MPSLISLRAFPRDLFGFFHIRFDAVDILLLLDDGVEIFVEALSDKRCQDAVDAVDRLTSVLTACNLCDDLCGDGASDLETLRRIDLLAVNHRAVREHVLEIDEAAVEHRLDDVVHIVKMNRARIVRLDDIRRDEKSPRDILRDFARDEVTLRGDDFASLFEFSSMTSTLRRFRIPTMSWSMVLTFLLYAWTAL